MSSLHWAKGHGAFIEVSCYDVSEALSFVTCFYVGLEILLHGVPIVPRAYELVN